MNANPNLRQAAGLFLSAMVFVLSACSNLPDSSLASTVIPPEPNPFAPSPQGDFTPPVAKQTVAPQFPVELRRMGVSGFVKVECLIDERGRVSQPRAIESSDDVLIAPALAAITAWTFEPARRAGQPVASLTTIPLRFALNP